MLESTQGLTLSSGIVLLAPVALLTDLPDDGLVRGQVGTVVEMLPPDGAAVEFVDTEGKTYAVAFLQVEHLVALYHFPTHQMA